MIPKLSAPLVKDIRTGEGVLEWILAALDLAAGVTGNLSVSHTVLYGTILAAVKGARRGLLKIVALQKSAGIGEPLQPAVLGHVAELAGHLAENVIPPAEQVLSEISAAEQAAAAKQAEPGTPATDVKAGLSPDDLPAKS